MTPQHGKLQELTPNYITDKFIDFITISSLYQDIFLGMDPYTNNLLMFLSAGLGINHSFRSPIGAKGSTTPLPDTVLAEPFTSES